MTRSLNNVSKNNARLTLSSPSNSEIGGTIIDYDGNGGREAMVIGLSLNLRYEGHFLKPYTQEVN